MIERLRAHYGFGRTPFGRNLAPSMLHQHRGHAEAVARIAWLISERAIGVVTGEVGAGKTVAARAAVAGLDPVRHTIVYLPNPCIGQRGLYAEIVRSLGGAPRFHKASLVAQAAELLAAEEAEKAKTTVVIIDEAHLLSAEQLEEVRMLTNHDMDARSPFACLLLGQPTLRRRLKVGTLAALDRVRRRADTWHMWGAAYLICDGLCSGDGFWYFQVWLIGLGRDAFERAVANPDNLAGLPEVLRLAGRPVDDWSNDEWPDWESLSYVAWEAYEQVTGEEEGLYDAMEAQGHHSPSDPDPTGERWDFEDPAEAAQRLPRLSWMFPLTDPATRDQRGREAFERLLAERGQTEEEFIAEFLGGRAGAQEPPDQT